MDEKSIKLNFKSFVEMAHVMMQSRHPITIKGNRAKFIDMKFENYPDPILKKKLLNISAKFYGLIPNRNIYVIYDGQMLDVNILPPEEDEYILLPSDWADYALIVNDDGSVKEPTKP